MDLLCLPAYRRAPPRLPLSEWSSARSGPHGLESAAMCSITHLMSLAPHVIRVTDAFRWTIAAPRGATPRRHGRALGSEEERNWLARTSGVLAFSAGSRVPRPGHYSTRRQMLPGRPTDPDVTHEQTRALPVPGSGWRVATTRESRKDSRARSRCRNCTTRSSRLLDGWR
jgi:hypothetical protein